MFRKALLAGACALALLSGPARASTHYSQIGDWDVRVDTSVGNGCFTSAKYREGSIVRIGFDKNERVMYFMFGNENWSEMDVGKSYAVRFLFDDGTYFDGSPNVIRLGGSTFLAVKSHAEFFGEFARRNTLKIIMQSNNKQLMHVSLRGTYAAALEVLRCQGAQDGRNYLGS